jgi:ribonuclease BN (tRNA processing enzyme)
MRVTVLGSGDAFGSGGRLHSSYLVEAAGTTILVDCGASVLQGLKRAGVDPACIDAVLLSHLHGDHFGGVPFLFLEYKWETPRTRPLAIYGPADTEARVEDLYAALYERTARGARAFEVRWVRAHPAAEMQVGGLTVCAYPVPHSPDLECLAYRITGDGRSVLYSGDSAWTDDFARWARGVDLFVCECSTYETKVPIHVSYREVAARATQLGCKRLLLSHLGREVLEHLSEVRLECAQDGMVIEV